MQLLLRSSPALLAAWDARPCSAGADLGPEPADRRDVYERVVAHEAPGAPLPAGPFRRAACAILRYDIFPPALLERVLAREPLGVGDTVGARLRIAPGLDLFFASRVIAAFDDFDGGRGLHRAGFTYRTLAGHPELGEETFSVEKQADSGAVTVALRSWSRAGLWITRVGWPLARCIQVRASRAALTHLEQLAHRAPT